MQAAEGDPGLTSARRTVTPAFTLHAVGQYALDKAESTEEGSFLELVVAMLMCPLTMEAVLNHVGDHAFVKTANESALWDAVERLAPRRKLEAIAERCRLRIDMGVRPFQDFGAMFKYRDELVHAKTMTLASDEVPRIVLEAAGHPRGIPALQANWERVCTVENATLWRESVVGMSTALCAAADCTNPVFIGGMTVGWG